MFLGFEIWKTKSYHFIKNEEAQKIEKNFHTERNGEFSRSDRKQNVVQSDVDVYQRKLMKTCFIDLFNNRCTLQFERIRAAEMRDKLEALRGRHAVQKWKARA